MASRVSPRWALAWTTRNPTWRASSKRTDCLGCSLRTRHTRWTAGQRDGHPHAAAMILVSKDGRVVNRNVHITELEAEIKKHLK